MKRVATCIIEVRDGRVVNYNGSYDTYLYAVNKEIEDGERELATKMSKAPPPAGKTAKSATKAPRRSDREMRKELSTVEKAIARLDQQKKQLSAAMLETNDAKEALRLHNELETVTQQLNEAEEKWCVLQEEMNEDA